MNHPFRIEDYQYAEYMTTFEEFLTREGHIVYRTKGVSMEPMLHQNRDIIVVSAIKSRLKPMDVALYKRGKNYVLHRVIKDKGDHYLIRGDNTYSLEKVPDSAILGVLTEFTRKGKKYSVENRIYQFYACFWNAIFPLRLLYIRCRRVAVRIARRVGIVSLIKKTRGQYNSNCP